MSSTSNVLIRLNGISEYQISYADNGNIITKTDVGDYLYDAGSKPHAMRGIEGVAGYGVTDDPQALSYTYFNKVSSVEQTAQRYNIYYGLDHQRRKSEKLREGHLYHTRYYMGSCEIDIDSLGQECISEYIYTPSGLTAIYREGQLLYVHSDHLGSIAAVSDSASRVVCTYAYTPWGGRLLLSGESVTDRGYTLHEHIDPFGLIDMSGRMYDPVLARFLSPDPYVQAPDFTQSFNRYAYCWNNPFSYTDPSGEFVITTAVIVGIAVGAAIGAAIGAYQGYQIGVANGATGWGMAGYTFAGIGIGAVGGAAAGFVGGAVAGAVAAAGLGGFTAGAVGGFINGAGMTWLGGGSFGQAMNAGFMGMATGAVTGFVVGGTVQGIISASQGNSFWTGKSLAPAIPATEIKPYNANYQNNSEVKVPDKIYHYSDKNPKAERWTTLGKIDASLEKPTFFTTNSELGKVSAVNDLTLDKIPNFRIEVAGNALDPNKIMLIRTVTGNVNGQGGGGWEILYNGYIDLKVVKIVVTPLP